VTVPPGCSLAPASPVRSTQIHLFARGRSTPAELRHRGSGQGAGTFLKRPVRRVAPTAPRTSRP
jgi:hypothetical protein